MGSAAIHKKKSPLDRYHEGSMTLDQFLDKLLNGKEGDRNRRRIVEKHRKTFTQTSRRNLP